MSIPPSPGNGPQSPLAVPVPTDAAPKSVTVASITGLPVALTRWIRTVVQIAVAVVSLLVANAAGLHLDKGQAAVWLATATAVVSGAQNLLEHLGILPTGGK